MDELNAVTDDELRKKLMELTKDFETLRIHPEAEALADQYIKKEIFPEKYRDDALHLAVIGVHA